MMKVRKQVLVLCALIVLLFPLGSSADVSGGSETFFKDYRCEKGQQFATLFDAPVYSYRTPLLIRAHKADNPDQWTDQWVFGDACVKEENRMSRAGNTWSSLAVGNYDTVVPLERADVPPGTVAVGAVAIPPGTSPYLYVPVVTKLGDFERVSIQDGIRIGIDDVDKANLEQAGLLVRKGRNDSGSTIDRVWVGFSTDFDTAAGRDYAAKTLSDIRFLKIWEGASKMLCSGPNSPRYEKESEAHIARALMGYDSENPIKVRPDFNCTTDYSYDEKATSNQSPDGMRPWGGGVGIIELFPNLKLDKPELEPTYVGSDVFVSLTLQSQTADTGLVQFWCAYEGGDEDWEKCGTATLNVSYQENVPVNVTIKQPKEKTLLHILAVPDEGTTRLTLARGNALPAKPVKGQDLETLYGKKVDQARPLSEAQNDPAWPFTSHYAEKMIDNVQILELEPLCDLQIALSTDGFASPEGFQIQTIVTRTQCTALESATVTLTVNGERVQVKPGPFAGETATISFESGPIDMGDAEEVTASLVATVDAGNYVPESNEENNTVTRAVVIGRPADPTFTCPSGLSPDQCFTTQITN